MNKIFALMLLLILTVSSLTVVFPVKAEAKTIIVPDDYSTITAAIGNATNGEVILIRSGTYLENSLIIDKTISLIGENVQKTIIRNNDKPTMVFGSGLLAGPNAVTIKASNVIISRLTIVTNNTGADSGWFGYDIAGGGVGTQILYCNLPDGIALSSGSYQLIAQNIIGEIVNRYHFTVLSGAPYTYITNNTITGAVRVQNQEGHGPFNNVVYANSITTTTNDYFWDSWGINIYMTQSNLVAKNEITNSRAGIVSELSSYNTITGNTINNCYVGVAAIQGGGGDTFFANNLISNSYSVATAGYNDTFYCNNFLNNAQQIGNPDMIMGPNARAAITSWYKGAQGNYWSNYAGLDENGDGVGDTPYTIDTNNTDPYPLMAPFNLVTVTLPDWASNISPAVLPSTFPTPAPPSAPTATSTASPVASSPTVSPLPFQTPETPKHLEVITLIILLTVTTMALIYFKRNRKIRRI